MSIHEVKLYRSPPCRARSRLLESMPAHRRQRLARRLTRLAVAHTTPKHGEMSWRRRTVSWWSGTGTSPPGETGPR